MRIEHFHAVTLALDPTLADLARIALIVLSFGIAARLWAALRKGEGMRTVTIICPSCRAGIRDTTVGHTLVCPSCHARVFFDQDWSMAGYEANVLAEPMERPDEMPGGFFGMAAKGLCLILVGIVRLFMGVLSLPLALIGWLAEALDGASDPEPSRGRLYSLPVPPPPSPTRTP